MKRREFIMLVGGAATAWPLIADAHEKEVPIVGIISALDVAWLGFYDGLNRAGFSQSKNVKVDYQLGSGQYEELAEMAADLVHRKVDVIVAFGSTEASIAKRATTTIPIVFESGDPIAEGLVANLARPEANLTGLSLMDGELMPKRLQLLSELVPAARKFALLVNPSSGTATNAIRNTQAAALKSGIELHVLRASTFDELDAAFQSISRLHPDGLIVDIDKFFSYGGGSRVVIPAIDAAIPAIYGWSELAWAGGLLSYGPSLTVTRRQIGVLTGRILKGEKTADLPVEQPVQFELVINRKTAKSLGLTVPQVLLARADEVIE